MNTLLLNAPVPAVAAEVVASLPMSYAVGTDRADVVVVAGSDGWPARADAAIRRGARGVIIVDPAAEPAASVHEVRASAASAGTVVLLSESWAGNPAVEGVRERWGGSFAAARTIESFVVEPVSGLRNADLLLRQVRVLRRLGAAGARVRGGGGTSRAYSLAGDTVDGVRLALAGVRSAGSAPKMEVVITGATQTVSLSLTSAETAKPASAVLTTPTGGDVLPTIYETGHRATFRRMHRLIASGEPVDELGDFVTDAALAADLDQGGAPAS